MAHMDGSRLADHAIDYSSIGGMRGDMLVKQHIFNMALTSEPERTTLKI